MLVPLLAAHAVLAVAAPFLARRMGRAVLLVCGLAPLATTLAAAVHAPAIVRGRPVEATIEWAPALGLTLDLRLDAFALLMVALVSGIGTLVFVYAYGYFGARADIGRLAGLLVAFSGAMLGLVLVDNVLLLFVFWELTSITSYLLIGSDDRDRGARAAALQALLTTGAGGLALLGGMVLIGQAGGTYSLSALLAAPPTGPAVDVGLILVLLGAFTKSVQVPFHSWLPAAMAAPTPVSTYLHSATMVKAGVYLVARLAPAFAATAAPWQPVVITVGLVTMLLGGWRALRQHDLKLVLAYGTISQLGFLTVLLGTGTPEATLAGAALLLAHGLFKATLFMVVGIVDRQAGTRDVRRLSGLHRTLRPTFVVTTVAALSMAGGPPLVGFVAKEAAYEAFLSEGLGTAGPSVLAGVVLGSVLTVAYSVRFVWGAFATKAPRDLGADVVTAAARPGRALVAPAAVLAVVTLAAGVLPALVSDLVVGGALAVDPTVDAEPLALWHGVNEALVLSVLTLGAGAVLGVRRRWVEDLQGRVPRRWDAGDAYRGLLGGTSRVADRVTGLVQHGSLPAYLAVILATVLVLPGGALLTGTALPDGLRPFDRPAQVGVAVVIVTAALAVAVIRSRFAAVLCLGAVGYGVAVLFVIHGAPDLALTQLVVETLVLVVFVLVLRHLPERFEPPRRGVPQAPRVLLAAGVGVFAAAFAVVAASARTAAPVSLEQIARALPEAEGRNIVNVILVDFRAFDTLNEIAVLTVAALGVTGLVRAARRERQRGSGGEATAPRVVFRPSPVLDSTIRLVFRTLLLLSLYELVSGHNTPGGGFVGGLVAGAAFVLLYVSQGARGLRRSEPLAPELLMGTGVALATLTGAASWLWGGEFLESASTTLQLPVLGEVKLLSTLPFDVGVYLVVLGVVLALLRSLGREGVQAA